MTPTRSRSLHDRLSSAFSRSPDSNLYHLTGVFADEYDQARYTLQDMVDARAYSTATGPSLDRIAALIGMTRLAGETDAALRTRYVIELNNRRTSGTRADVISVINANANLQYGEDYLLLEPPDIPAPSRNQAAFVVDLLKEDGHQQYDPDRLYAVLQEVKPVGVMPTFRHRRTLHGAQAGGSTTSIHTEREISVMPGPQVARPTLTTGTRHTREDRTTWNQDFSDLTGWTMFTGGPPGNPSASADGALHLACNAQQYGGNVTHVGVQQTIDLTDVGEIHLDAYVTSSWCLKWGHFQLRIGDDTVLSVSDSPTCGGDDPDIPPPWHRNLIADVRSYTGNQTVAFLALVDGSSSSTSWRTSVTVENVRFIRPV